MDVTVILHFPFFFTVTTPFAFTVAMLVFEDLYFSSPDLIPSLLFFDPTTTPFLNMATGTIVNFSPA